jgi:hypothetical protein
MHGKVDTMVVVAVVGAVVDQAGTGLVRSGQGEMTTAAAAATMAGNVDSGLRRCLVLLVLAPARSNKSSPPQICPCELQNHLFCTTIFSSCELHIEVVFGLSLRSFCYGGSSLEPTGTTLLSDVRAS